MHLLLTGATGLVGSAVLQTMLTTPSITKITILSRRPVLQAEAAKSPKVHTIIHKDFASYPPSVMEELKDVKGVVWALGISSTLVAKPEYENITSLYPLTFARALSSTVSPNPVNFVYVSGTGATTSPGMLTQHWARTKGETEAALLLMSKTERMNLKPYSIRPAGVDPALHGEIRQWIPKLGGVLGVVAAPLLGVMRTVLPSGVSPTRELGKVAVELAMGDGKPLEGKGVEGECRTALNEWLRRAGGL